MNATDSSDSEEMIAATHGHIMATDDDIKTEETTTIDMMMHQNKMKRNSLKKTRKNKFEYDVFFWLGAETTQDEAGTAAYKTVELDDYLNDEPIQYREV